MKNGTQPNCQFGMESLKLLPLVFGVLFASVASADDVKPGLSATRGQVKMERDEFMKSHQWDHFSDNWVMKPDYDAPTGMKSRVEVKAARDEFLRNNRWDQNARTWISMKEQPRDLGKMSREEVRAEITQFQRTHRWSGESAQGWVDINAGKKK